MVNSINLYNLTSIILKAGLPYRQNNGYYQLKPCNSETFTQVDKYIKFCLFIPAAALLKVKNINPRQRFVKHSRFPAAALQIRPAKALFHKP